MRHNKHEKQNRKKYGMLLLLLAAVLALIPVQQASAAKKEEKKIEVRLIFTTDLHGQVSPINYETGKDFNTGSLAKAYTLIKKARSQKKNTLTFDIGDVLYDYSTEYILSHYPSGVQPIYKAMGKVGYDAITLGNHDFDYGLSYVQSQLSGSGLKSKAVVSNVTYSTSGKYVWKKNLMLTKTMTATDGSKVKVKVGIIGETIPNLSSKTENYLGTLATTDILASVKKQAAALKKDGADVIVVLAHSGFGPTNPDEKYKNVVYAMSKIKNVDVILCGHEHNMFPSTDSASAAYYELPGVDKKTGLVNDTCVVMSKDRGQSIGLADLTLSVKDGEKTISKMKGTVRQVTSSTKADSTITSYMSTLGKEMIAAAQKEVGNVAPGEILENYFGLLKDNAVAQLTNDAKMSYAMRYIHNSASLYQKYPVVAMSEYNRYGGNGSEDYTHLTGSLYGSDLSALEDYNRYVAIYGISGTQLKKYVEWAASAYAQSGKKIKWSDATMKAAQEDSGLNSLVQEDWLEDWSKFFVFDGIEYTIDTSVAPRYNKAGVKINDSWRVSSLTVNGEKVTSGMMLILVCDRVTKPTEANNGVDANVITRGSLRGQEILQNYLMNQSMTGGIQVPVDYNWSIQQTGSQVIVVHSQDGQGIAEQEGWFGRTLKTKDGYGYSAVSIPVSQNIPHVVLSAATEETTNHQVKVYVQASSGAGIKSLKVVDGSYGVEAAAWESATTITEDYFTAYGNGAYTVLAEDNSGGKNVGRIYIDNIDQTVLQVPTVISYTNRKTLIQGKAEPGGTIYFQTQAGLYSDTVKEDGTYAYALPAQEALSKVYVYVKDAIGRSSKKLEVVVKRTGPNQPVVKAFTNKASYVTGSFNDTYVTVYAAIGSKVYVAASGVNAWKNCERYTKSKSIVKTTVTIKDGTFKMKLPIQYAEKKVYVYTIDHLGRCSRSNIQITQEVAPNLPDIYASYSVMSQVSGRVPQVKEGQAVGITVNVDGMEYQGTCDANGYYTVPVNKLVAGSKITVTATDAPEGTIRTSAKATATTGKITKYISSHEESLWLDTLNSKSTAITGSCTMGNTTITLTIGKKVETVNTDDSGNFTFPLVEPLAPGTKVYAFRYSSHGSLKAAAVETVEEVLPAKPVIVGDILTDSTTQITVSTTEMCTMYMKTEEKTYETTDCTQDPLTGLYWYTFSFDPQGAGTEVKFYGKNAGGTGKKLTVIVESAP